LSFYPQNVSGYFRSRQSTETKIHLSSYAQGNYVLVTKMHHLRETFRITKEYNEQTTLVFKIETSKWHRSFVRHYQRSEVIRNRLL